MADARTSQIFQSITISPGPLHLKDDVQLDFGTSHDASFLWETADANANCLLLGLPTGGAVNVPVFTIGLSTSINSDLGLFNGFTRPTLALLEDDGQNAGWMNYNPVAGTTGGAPGQLEISASGDLQFAPTGALAGRSTVTFRPPTTTSKDMIFSAIASKAGGKSGFELGEPNASLFFMRYDGTFDQAGWYLTSFSGRQGILADSSNRDLDQDIVVQDHPLFAVKSVLNPNTDNAEHVGLMYKGLRCGSTDNADFESSSFAMETDRATFDFTVSAVNAFVSAANTTNANGAQLYLRAGHGNTAHTVAATGGSVIAIPGKNDTGGGGSDGKFLIRHPDEGANDDIEIWHDATRGHLATASGDLRIDAATDFVGINVNPTSPLHVEQSNAAGAISVLKISQQDTDETFLDYIGTSAADTSASISTEPANDTSGAAGANEVAAPHAVAWNLEGMVRVDINGAQFWMPYYSAV